MGAREIPAEVLSETLAAVRLYGSISEAARRLGVNRLTFSHRYRVALAQAAEPVIASLPQFSSKPLNSDNIANPSCRIGRVTYKDEGPVIRVVAWGDHHDKPGRPKERALWMSRHAAEARPDVIVSIGDLCSLDSLSAHEKPGSQNDAERPAFFEELESLDECLSLLTREVREIGCPLIHCHGNHEHRAVRAGNLNPKISGDLPIRLDNVFHRYGFRTYPFGQFVDVGGVDFVHVPLSIMGKEIGGEFAERTIGNRALRSVIFGHTHRANIINLPKVGLNKKLTVINLGTSMPWGMTEKYNGLSTTGWSYGVWDIRIRAGEVIGWKFLDMLELFEKYGD